eukprot:349720-Chlamydomonas_euryale.AAC.4
MASTPADIPHIHTCNHGFVYSRLPCHDDAIGRNRGARHDLQVWATHVKCESVGEVESGINHKRGSYMRQNTCWCWQEEWRSGSAKRCNLASRGIDSEPLQASISAAACTATSEKGADT